jgi:hypothetical protein
MRWFRGNVAAVAAVAGCLVVANAAEAASPVSLQRDGSVEIAGRKLRCARVRNTLDPRLPNLGISIPARRLLIINPALLQRYSDTVRLFVFHHECGHHHVGGSELSADCWAVERGVREGWLAKPGLTEVCKSFGGVPATPTHPSAARRCSNLERCFASASASVARAANPEEVGKAQPPPASAAPPRSPSGPELVAGPTLVRKGYGR